MKKIFITFNFLVLVLLINSCGDILNPEPDTHTTKIKYHSVLKDQENSVIMPLKVGNIWVYKVTELNGDGSVNKISYDTTLVRKDTLLKDEQWFLVDDPSQSEELFFFTNTDVGLNIACTKCPNCKLLRAEYPKKYLTYLLREDGFPIKMGGYSENGERIDEYMAWLNTYEWIDVELIKSYISSYGVYDTYLYNLRGEANYINNQNVKIDVKPENLYNEYFVPNLGLVRKEYWSLRPEPTKTLFMLRELIYTNVKI
ncbi:MAG: hypothetical protein WCR42_04955 [bacterium]